MIYSELFAMQEAETRKIFAAVLAYVLNSWEIIPRN